jgi:hypothetical protein
MVGGACMDGFECGSAEEFLFAGFFALGLAGLLERGICFCFPSGLCLREWLFLLTGPFVPAGGGCFCFPGGLCLREVCSFASRIWLVGPTPGECWRMIISHGFGESLTMAKVKWTGDDPFCLGGDSGALIYTVLRGVKLPIGIHKGSRPGVSVCWLLGGVFVGYAGRLGHVLRLCGLMYGR